MGIRDTGEGTTVMDKRSGSAEIVAGLISRARVAMRSVSGYDQERVNEVVQAVAWAIIERERAEELARIAVEDTGLGSVEDKVRQGDAGPRAKPTHGRRKLLSRCGGSVFPLLEEPQAVQGDGDGGTHVRQDGHPERHEPEGRQEDEEAF